MTIWPPVMSQQRHLMRMHFWYLLKSLLTRISCSSLPVAPERASGARHGLNTPDAALCSGAHCCEVCMPSPCITTCAMFAGRVQAGGQAAAGVRGRASCLIPRRVPRRAGPPAHGYRGRKDVASHCISQQPLKLFLLPALLLCTADGSTALHILLSPAHGTRFVNILACPAMTCRSTFLVVME